MPGIFLTQPLAKTATNGPAWDDQEASFPMTQIFATITLSHYQTQTPERFLGFQPSWAQAWIETSETPVTVLGPGIVVPLSRDNTVFLTTDHLKFQLQVNNGGNSNPAAHASAVGVIYDYGAARSSDVIRPVKEIHLAVHDEDGIVVRTHRSVQFDGGADFDEEQTRERLLTEVQAVSGLERESFKVAKLRAEDLPHTSDFRVNPSTGRAEPRDS